MIIAYKVRHRNHLNEIELCGQFSSEEELKKRYRYGSGESIRGWELIQSSIKIRDTGNIGSELRES